jgi:hypothetical protein
MHFLLAPRGERYGVVGKRSLTREHHFPKLYFLSDRAICFAVLPVFLFDPQKLRLLSMNWHPTVRPCSVLMPWLDRPPFGTDVRLMRVG